MERNETHILVVDDEVSVRGMIVKEFESEGYKVSSASRGEDALEIIKKDHVHVVFSDLVMPEMDGLEILEKAKAINPDIEVIMVTGHATLENAVEALQKGAFDYIQKPFNLDQLSLIVKKAVEKNQLKGLVGLYEASKVLFSTLDLDELLNHVMDIIQKVLRADEGSIMLLDQDQMLSIAASRGLDKQVVDKSKIALGEGVSGRVAQKKKDYLLINGVGDHPDFKGIKGNTRIKSSLVCPLLFKGEVLGVLNLNRISSDILFTEADLRLARIFASQVAQAVENAQLYKGLEEKMAELKATQNQLIRTEKLATVGRLVSGVAHEINNPLTTVIGFLQLSLESSLSGEIKENIKTAYDEAHRCRRVVQDLLIFARQRSPQRVLTDPADLISKSLGVLTLQTRRANILIEKNFTTPCPSILVDPHQMSQVFLNMITNACHALETKSGMREIKISILRQEDQVLIQFQDNGPGIPHKNIEKIFDPFFTTKEVGKGTGLGLSLCYGIVREHEGTIKVESEQGKGATFTIALSAKKTLDSPMVSEDKKEKSEKQIKSQKKRKILLIEDEVKIAELLQKVLKQAGHEVVTLNNGQSALDNIKSHQYDTIITDYKLPKMDGRAFYQAVKAHHPDVLKRIFFITGSISEDLECFLKNNEIACLRKPFSGRDLIATLEENWSSES